ASTRRVPVPTHRPALSRGVRLLLDGAALTHRSLGPAQGQRLRLVGWDDLERGGGSMAVPGRRIAAAGNLAPVQLGARRGTEPEQVEPTGAWSVPVGDAPLGTGDVELAGEEVLVPVAVRGCEDEPSAPETEPSKEQPASATSSSAGSSRRAEDMITRPTLETP